MKKRLAVVYLASPRAFRAGGTLRIDALDSSLASVEASLRPVMPDFDVLIFHEDYTEADQASLRLVSPGCKFFTVDFSGGDFVDFGHRKGYMHMCRFWSGIVQRHSALQDYSHYMRMDDDSFFIRPKLQEVEVRRMLANDYSYRQVYVSHANQYDTFFDFTCNFLKSEGLHTNDITAYLTENGKYRGKAIYNNFHVASLKLWRHPVVERYVDALEAENGWLGKGWVDDGVHTMIVVGIMPQIAMSSNAELDFGYRHNCHFAMPGELGLRIDPNFPFVAEPHEYA